MANILYQSCLLQSITSSILSPYLKYHLREEMSNGEDYMILSFKSYQQMVKMGYKMGYTLEPAMWITEFRKHMLHECIVTMSFFYSTIALLKVMRNLHGIK
eukprot:450207_1